MAQSLDLDAGPSPWEDLAQRHDFLEPGPDGRATLLFTGRIHRRDRT